MPKCPKCGKDIGALFAERRVNAVITESYNFSRANGLTPMPERDETDVKDVLGETYRCPECDGEVAKSSEEAYELLATD